MLHQQKLMHSECVDRSVLDSGNTEYMNENWQMLEQKGSLETTVRHIWNAPFKVSSRNVPHIWLQLSGYPAGHLAFFTTRFCIWSKYWKGPDITARYFTDLSASYNIIEREHHKMQLAPNHL